MAAAGTATMRDGWNRRGCGAVEGRMEPKWRGDEGRVDGRWRGTGGVGIAAGTASSSRGKIDGEMLVRSVVAVNTADE